MDEPHVAELLPGLYRDVLDAVAILERHGQRHMADRVREDATRAYSKAWDQVAARRLRRLREEALRAAVRHGARPVRPWAGLRRRPVEGRPA